MGGKIRQRSRKRKNPKRILALPDLTQAKASVLNTLTSKSGQRTYDHAIDDFVEWYCSDPRLAFSRTVVLLCRIQLGQNYTHLPPSIFVWLLFVASPTRRLTRAC